MDLIDPPEDPHREGMDDESLGQLADSLAHEGLHQPIGLLRSSASERFTIIYGHRRWAAASLCRWGEIPARIYPEGTDVLVARASENNNREQLTPLEEARVIRRFVRRGESLAATARLLRRSATWITSRLALLDQPEELQAAVHAGQLSLAVAAALADVDHVDYRQELIREAIQTGATGPTVAVWVQHYLANRDRIVANHMVVRQILEERHAWRITVQCDYCAGEQGYDETRAWRLCISCHNGLVQQQAAARAEASQENGSQEALKNHL